MAAPGASGPDADTEEGEPQVLKRGQCQLSPAESPQPLRQGVAPAEQVLPPEQGSCSGDGEASGDRATELARVFLAFDLDGSGYIEASEMMALGQRRREMRGQERGSWSEARSSKHVARIDADGDGKLDREEFVRHWLGKLQCEDAQSFSASIMQFMTCAASIGSK